MYFACKRVGARTLECNKYHYISSGIMSNPGSTSASGANTPASRFTKTTETLEDALKTQTVGLVRLSEFKKRRAELLEQKEREAAERGRVGIDR